MEIHQPFNLDSDDFVSSLNGETGAVNLVAGSNITITPAGQNITIASTSAPGGSNTQVQFNDSGVFGGDAGLTYNKTTDALTVGGSITDPLLIGGTTTTSPLTLRSTSGVGTTGADIIFQTGNNGATEAMRILNNGNVGIGTTSPSKKLDIVTTVVNDALRVSGPSPILVINGTVGATDANIQFQSAGAAKWDLYNWLDNTFRLYNYGLSKDVLTVDTSGNVGIGTTSPTNLLHLLKTQNASTYVIVDNLNTGSSGVSGFYARNSLAGGISFSQTSTGYSDVAGFANRSLISADTTSDGINIESTKSTGDIRFKTGSYLPAFERMRIDSSGNVGIGTTTPNGKLDVVSATATNSANFASTGLTIASIPNYAGLANFVINSDSSNGLIFMGYGASANAPAENIFFRSRGTPQSPSAIQSGDAIGTLVFTGQNSTTYSSNAQAQLSVYASENWTNTAMGTNMRFYATPTGSNSQLEAMRILGSGKVGIGTTNPTQKLHVSGDGGSAGISLEVEDTNTSNAGVAYLGSYLGNAYMQAATGKDLQLWDGSAVRLTIQNGGNVGIGTTSPNYKLEVATGAANNLAAFSDYSTNPAQRSVFAFNKSASNTVGTLAATADGELLGQIAGSGVLSGNNAFENAIAIQFYQEGASGATRIGGNIRFSTGDGSSDLAERMRITKDGKVGIGTNAPSAFLHVIGTTEQQRIGYDTSNYYKTTVGSTGGVTFDAVGSGSGFTFSDAVAMPAITGTGTGGTLLLNQTDTTGLLQFGGTSISFPALRHVGAQLQVVTADLSIFAGLKAQTLTATDFAFTGGNALELIAGEASVLNGVGGSVYTPFRADQIRLMGASNITVDTGIGRNGAGIVEVNNGTLGTLRDLIVRDIKATTYHVGSDAGIDATVTYVDTLLGAQTLVFKKGILTSQS